MFWATAVRFRALVSRCRRQWEFRSRIGARVRWKPRAHSRNCWGRSDPCRSGVNALAPSVNEGTHIRATALHEKTLEAIAARKSKAAVRAMNPVIKDGLKYGPRLTVKSP